MRELSKERIEKLKSLASGVSAGQAVAASKAAAVIRIDDVRRAMVEGMFLLSVVDGEVSDEEIGQFTKAAESIFGPDADVDALLGAMAAALAGEGWDRRMRAVAQSLRGKPEAETAYRLAIAVAFVDDSVAHAESAALDAFASAVDISSERATELMGEVHRELFG